VSNPPYICEKEKKDMAGNVLKYEPDTALFVPDEDPLRFYRQIAELGRKLLRPGGKLYFEINQAYGQDMIRMIEMNQYRDVRVIKDIFGKDRIVTANR
jgi:release factor glutamine methyltransferase